MPTAKPVPTAIWPVPTPAYADGDVPTVAVGTDCADDIFSYADGYRPSAPCLLPVVRNYRILFLASAINHVLVCTTGVLVPTVVLV
jgi:hypothetical protein